MSANVVFLLFVFGAFVCIAGVVYYLKRRGVLRAAANAATQAVKQDVSAVADKLSK